MQTFTGYEYLQMEIAAQTGLDKNSWEERLAWTEKHEDYLEDVPTEEIDDFYQYHAAVLAYRKAQAGEPIGYLCGPDACSSGPQILSTLTGCLVGCANTGVTGQKRMDAYLKVTQAMNKLLQTCNEYERSIVKDAFMTFFYGSSKEPKKAFGNDTPELDAFYDATSIVCPGAAGLVHFMLSLWDSNATEYRWVMPDGFTAVCKVIDTLDTKIEIDTIPGHPVFEYRHQVNQPIEAGEEGSLFLAANCTHSVDGFVVRELTARCDYDPGQLRSAELLLVHRLQKNIEIAEPVILIECLWKRHNQISIEGVEYVNEWSVSQMSKEYCWALLNLIRKTQKKAPFHVITIHDQFKSHPNNLNWVRQIYIDIFAEMADSTILNSIFSDITGETIEIEKLSKPGVLSALIKEAEYPLA